jgi:thioredoxin-like negative regulator of GroEL
MENDRLQFLRQALEAMPDDAFTRYALAVDLASSGQKEEAWQHFEYLLAHHPDYSATYYQAGMFLLTQGRREEARKALAKGIEVTGRQDNSHAQKQLQAALDMLGGTS